MIRFLKLAVALQRCISVLAAPLTTPLPLSLPSPLHDRPNTTILFPTTLSPSNGTNPLPPMPSHDIIIHLTSGLAVLITYDIGVILPKADTIACLQRAQNDIPPSAEAMYPIPGPQLYICGDVVLSLLPNSSPAMLWNEWNATVRALEWFTEEYEALAMTFSVTNMFDGSKARGEGAIEIS